MSLVDAHELNGLVAQYGEPLRLTPQMQVSRETIREWLDTRARRHAEIALVMPRPGNRVLLHTKEFYPSGVFRVPTGGIHLGERVEDAARREMVEETGFTVSLARLLGIVEYDFFHAETHVPFVSYVFLTDETRDVPQPTDPNERIAQFRDVAWSDLPEIARTLAELPEPRRDWGRFRAVVHDLLASCRI